MLKTLNPVFKFSKKKFSSFKKDTVGIPLDSVAVNPIFVQEIDEKTKLEFVNISEEKEKFLKAFELLIKNPTKTNREKQLEIEQKYSLYKYYTNDFRKLQILQSGVEIECTPKLNLEWLNLINGPKAPKAWNVSFFSRKTLIENSVKNFTDKCKKKGFFSVVNLLQNSDFFHPEKLFSFIVYNCAVLTAQSDAESKHFKVEKLKKLKLNYFINNIYDKLMLHFKVAIEIDIAFNLVRSSIFHISRDFEGFNVDDYIYNSVDFFHYIKLTNDIILSNEDNFYSVLDQGIKLGLPLEFKKKLKKEGYQNLVENINDCKKKITNELVSMGVIKKKSKNRDHTRDKICFFGIKEKVEEIVNEEPEYTY